MRPTAVLLALVCLSSVALAAEESPGTKAPAGTRVSRTDAPAPKSNDAQTQTTAEHALPFKAEHPGDTALSQDELGNWRFRSFPALATLYVYDKDVPGKSNCGAPCTSAWAPFLASSSENEPIGDWTLISRPDGRHQWAYKGQPVYLRYHDLPATSGNIARQGFSKLEP